MKKSVFKISVIASLLLILFSTSSCGIGLIVRGAVKSSLSVEKKTVPPNFIDNKEVLLVLLWGENSYDDYVKKAFEKFYDGKKEFVTFEQYFSGKYNDVNKFAYVFSQGPGEKKMYTGEPYSFTYEGSRSFHVYDRKNEKFYRSKINSGFFARVIQGYAMKLDKIRKNK
ncbi:MAG: hypothetical protein PHQ74_02250 [Crocinitomicaceae bacterium]|nr:hypothetical protein [Crocinitomicaceae bacterium]